MKNMLRLIIALLLLPGVAFAQADKAEALLDMDSLSPALREFCRIRKSYPDFSLRELGELYDPPVSKSALYHRYMRLKDLLEQARAEQIGTEDEQTASV